MQSGRARLRAWIQRSKVNQNEAADILGVHPVVLSQYLSGARVPGLASAVAIEQVTGIAVESWVQSQVSTDATDGDAETAKQPLAKR